MASNMPPEKGNLQTDPVNAHGKDEITTTLATQKSDSEFDHLEDNPKDSNYEKYFQAGLNEEESRFLSSFTPKQEAAIFRKVDFRSVSLQRQ